MSKNPANPKCSCGGEIITCNCPGLVCSKCGKHIKPADPKPATDLLTGKDGLHFILVKAFADISLNDEQEQGHEAYWNRRAEITTEVENKIVKLVVLRTRQSYQQDKELIEALQRQFNERGEAIQSYQQEIERLKEALGTAIKEIGMWARKAGELEVKLADQKKADEKEHRQEIDAQIEAYEKRLKKCHDVIAEQREKIAEKEQAVLEAEKRGAREIINGNYPLLPRNGV